MTKTYEEIVALVRDTLVDAVSTFRPDKKEAYRKAISTERNEQARWVLEQVLANAEAAETNKSPLCDDSGIPHLVRTAPWPAECWTRSEKALRRDCASSPDGRWALWAMTATVSTSQAA